MTDLRKAAEEAAKVLANALSIDFNDKRDWYSYKHDVEYAANLLRQALAQPEQEPVAWIPIEQMYPQAKAIDILMGDGSILCAVLPQFDGDLWWGGSGTGEKFIDPKYANVTHWRIHSDTAPPSKPWVSLTDEEIDEAFCNTPNLRQLVSAFKAGALWAEAALRSKNETI